MKISEMIRQLTDLHNRYGDLECVVYATTGIEPFQRARAHVVQPYDFGSIDKKVVGGKVAMLWER